MLLSRERSHHAASPAPTVGQRFLLVDALRGMAALSVVLFHAREGGHIEGLLAISPGWMSVALGHGSLGVAVFFVLSGFVIAHSLFDKPVDGSVLLRFMARRSLRLDPPYWVAIAVCIAFSYLALVFVKGSVREGFSIAQILAHIFYLHDILGYKTINTVFWTLCLEFQFYLIYALLLWFGNMLASGGRLKASEFLLLLSGVVSLLWPLGVAPDVDPAFFLSRWHGFLLGVGAYWAWRRSAFAPFFVAFLLVLVLAGFLNGLHFTLACCATSALLYAAAKNRALSLLDWAPLQFLGAISYSLYLTHNPVTGASFRVGYLLTGRSAFTEAVWWIASLGACILFAAALWRLIEVPSLALSRRITLLPRPVETQLKSIPGTAEATEALR